MTRAAPPRVDERLRSASRLLSLAPVPPLVATYCHDSLVASIEIRGNNKDFLMQMHYLKLACEQRVDHVQELAMNVKCTCKTTSKLAVRR